MFDPEFTDAEPTPQPAVPATTIVPACVVVITTLGVLSAVGVVTGVLSQEHLLQYLL